MLKTMLEVGHRFEILWAVQYLKDALIDYPIPTTKEIHYAAA
jgi:hypothetical protein